MLINLTPVQQRVIKDREQTKIYYFNEDVAEGKLGFCRVGLQYREIYLNKELKNDINLLMPIMIHELGHIDQNHLSDNRLAEYENIKQVIDKVSKNSNIKIGTGQGTLAMILNIAMDILVNSIYLTFGNVRYLKKNNLNLCTLGEYNLKVSDFSVNYRDYYENIVEDIIKKANRS